jgi:hypothetical protein
MSPQPKKYESNAERQRALRERKKKSLLQKLRDSLNGKSNEDAVQDNEECLIPNAEIQQKPNGTAVFLPPRENAPSTKSTICSQSQPLKSEKSTGRCELCGALMGFRTKERRCEFCSDYSTVEEMRYAWSLMDRVRHMRFMEYPPAQIEKMFNDAMKKYRDEHK